MSDEEKVLTKAIAEQFLADDGNDSAGDWVCEVDLSEFTAIGDDAAALLSNYYESTLYLNGLTTLSGEAALILSKFEYGLRLSGITELQNTSAHLALLTRLSNIGGYTRPLSLFFSQLKVVDDAAVAVLSKHVGPLSLNGLTEISDQAAEYLGKHQGELNLNAIGYLTDVAALRLSQHVDPLTLEGLRELSDSPGHIALAGSYAKHCFPNGQQRHGGAIHFALEQLSDAAAESLSKHKGALCLGELTELSDAAIESLSKHEGYLDLGLTSLSDAAADSLSKHQGPSLYLNGLVELSDTAAESLSKHAGEALYLDGLTILSDVAAESLSRHKGTLSHDGLTELSDVAAESLSRHAAENDQTTRALRLNLDDFDDNSKSAAKILRDAGHGHGE